MKKLFLLTVMIVLCLLLVGCGDGGEWDKQGLRYALSSDKTAYAVIDAKIEENTDIVIPSEYKGKPVTSIGTGAFYDCTGLTSITTPSSITSIGKGAFAGCTSLANLTVETGNTAYHSAGNCIIETATNTLVAGCKNSIIPADGSVTSIGEYAFRGCASLTNMTIPESVTSIGGAAFERCTSLTSITIPEGVTSIGGGAFVRCTSLTSITIPSSVTSIESTYPYTVLRSQGAVLGEGNVYNIYLFGSEEWSGGDVVTLVGTFSGCTSLTNVTFAENSQLTSIGKHAFQGCASLQSITIPSNVTSIGYWAFSYCENLESLTVETGNTTYHSAGNCIIETAANTLVIGCKSSIIPADGSVTSIGFEAFYGHTGLTSITIPSSVTSIDDSAFDYCVSLESVTFADTDTWYRTTNSDDWRNKTGGTETDVTNPSTNATYFTSTYEDYYWYKE